MIKLLGSFITATCLCISAASAEESLDLFSEVKAILAERCLGCHNAESKALNGGGLSLETREDILKGGKRGPALIANTPEKSLLYTTLTLPEQDALAMPPAGRFSRVPEKEREVIKDWIKQGAHWPEGEIISYRRQTPTGDQIDPTEMALVETIRAKILKNQNDEKSPTPYTEKLEGIRVTLKMLPIPAGEFRMKGIAADDEFTAKLDSFWMAEKELPWDLYLPFMEPKVSRNKDGYPQDDSQVKEGMTILAQPSQPYHAMSFGMGVRRHPAIAMTHHAANKYCQWLSWQTGHFYRLPTEAEWEYAARAGRTDDSPENIDLVAWYDESSGGTYRRIGKKSPNPWGLYDMLGNVMEWTLDGYVENRRAALGDRDEVQNPWIRAVAPYPHVCKGGHWNASISELSFSARVPSSPQWKISDPQSPKSIWYHTNITWLGFRPVRPGILPSAEEMYRAWNSGVAYDDVQ